MTWKIGTGGGLGLAMTWLYFMGWSSYGFETVAAFAPEYHDPERDTPRALRASAAFSVVVYALLPLGLGGTLGTQAVADDATFIAFYKSAFDILVGNALANGDDRVPDRGPAAVDEHGDDGRLAGALRHRQGRHDHQVSSGVLNSYSVPGLAMTMDAILNMFLITYFAGALDDPRGRQPRLHARARVRAQRLPAAAQGPAQLAAADQAGGGVDADRRAAGGGQPGVHRCRRIHLLRRLPRDRHGLRLRLGQDPNRPA